jgi:hypothetical protein
MIDEAKLRAWWSHRQALEGRLIGKTAAEILKQTGWARSVGGVNPYLTLFSRGGIGREAADSALARVEIHELPSARGCTYVIPSSDFALALKVGQGFGSEADLKTARKLGVTDAEIEKLCDAVVNALSRGPLDPDELREHTGGAVRSLGEEGKKKGLTSTLPLALGKLQIAGEIRRIPTNGRLDQQRYRYAQWRPNPMAKFKLSAEEACTELARRFFAWIGPAALAEFQWFSGLGVKAAKSAVEPLKLEVLQGKDDHLILPKCRAEIEEFKIPKQPQYVLVSSLDGIVLLRRNLRDLVAREDLKRKTLCENVFRELGSISDLYNHAILDRGRLVGLWDYDMETGSIAWTSFIAKDKALEEAVRNTEHFVREELGDARSFSLDSPKSRAPRIKALRDAGKS